jgi:hypothetical protein
MFRREGDIKMDLKGILVDVWRLNSTDSGQGSMNGHIEHVEYHLLGYNAA